VASWCLFGHRLLKGKIPAIAQYQGLCFDPNYPQGLRDLFAVVLLFELTLTHCALCAFPATSQQAADLKSFFLLSSYGRVSHEGLLTMTKYYFHIRDQDGLVSDGEGMNLSGIKAAKAEAVLSASDLAMEDHRCGRKFTSAIEVTDSHGDLIYMLPVRRNLH
jgi:hypothetical protein